MVTCHIYGREGQLLAAGANDCATPQEACPRLPGEGYAKCEAVCGQGGHAELQALAVLRTAPGSAQPYRAIVRGHTYACRGCQEALYAAGVMWVNVRPGP